jgi:transcriptional regulator with XRE-family HTH domain
MGDEVNPRAQPKELGRALLHLRRAHKMSRKTLAEAVGLRKEELANYETGRVPVPPEHLMLLTAVCGVNATSMFPDAVAGLHSDDPNIIDATRPPPPLEDAPEPLVWETLRGADHSVEVGEGGVLSLHRADERWALSAEMIERDFRLTVGVDLKSGPGFGVLFRAEVDESGALSGYSLEFDPERPEGAFTIRQWQQDWEFWQPLAEAEAMSGTDLYGDQKVAITVDDERLVATVNGVDVLIVENLPAASTRLGLEPARGDRVGVQAWPKSEVSIYAFGVD